MLYEVITIKVVSTTIPFRKVTRNTKFYELLAIPETSEFAEKAMNDSLESIKHMGALFAESMGDGGLLLLFEEVAKWKKYDGLRSMISFFGSGMSEADFQKLIDDLNRKLGL